MKQPINLRIEKDTLEVLDDYAKQLNKSRTNLIESAIEHYFDKMDELIADKRIDEIKQGKSEVLPLDMVFKQAGINV